MLRECLGLVSLGGRGGLIAPPPDSFGGRGGCGLRGGAESSLGGSGGQSRLCVVVVSSLGGRGGKRLGC